MQVPADVPAAAPRPPRPGRRGRWALLPVLLLAGSSVAADALDRPEAAPPRTPEPTGPSGPRQELPAVRATAQVVSQEAWRVRLLVEVRIGPQPAGAGLPGSNASPAQLRLQEGTAPGLAVRLTDGPEPRVLGSVGRFSSVQEQVARVTVEAVAQGCAAPQQVGPLALVLSRSTASSDRAVTVPVQESAEVAQALEALVRRTCAE